MSNDIVNNSSVILTNEKELSTAKQEFKNLIKKTGQTSCLLLVPDSELQNTLGEIASVVAKVGDSVKRFD